MIQNIQKFYFTNIYKRFLNSVFSGVLRWLTMAVGREVGTAVGVIIALAAINALLLTLNFLRLRRERRRLWVSNDGIMRGPTSFWAFEQLESDHLVRLWSYSTLILL